MRNITSALLTYFRRPRLPGTRDRNSGGRLDTQAANFASLGCARRASGVAKSRANSASVRVAWISLWQMCGLMYQTHQAGVKIDRMTELIFHPALSRSLALVGDSDVRAKKKRLRDGSCGVSLGWRPPPRPNNLLGWDARCLEHERGFQVGSLSACFRPVHQRPRRVVSAVCGSAGRTSKRIGWDPSVDRKPLGGYAGKHFARRCQRIGAAQPRQGARKYTRAERGSAFTGTMRSWLQ